MQVIVKENEEITATGHVCQSCGNSADKLYQNDLCRPCLSVVFKRLVKVIDSVRK